MTFARIVLILSCALVALAAQAQDSLFVLGTVDTYPSDTAAVIVEIRAEQPGRRSKGPVAHSGYKNRYEILLAYGRSYLVRFSALGYMAKSVELDLRIPPVQVLKDDDGTMVIHTRLFKVLPGIDEHLMDDALVKYEFDDIAGHFTWNLHSNTLMLERWEAFKVRYDERLEQLRTRTD